PASSLINFTAFQIHFHRAGRFASRGPASCWQPPFSKKMIRTKTTFIIGAGASHSYGLPTGIQLLDSARKLNARSPIFQLLLHGGAVSPQDLNAFIEDLKSHPVPSIDAYLQTRQAEKVTMTIG